jgi:hypothetical protein
MRFLVTQPFFVPTGEWNKRTERRMEDMEIEKKEGKKKNIR